MITSFLIGKTLGSAALGVATWSAAEYLIHKNLGHRFAKNRNFFAKEHVRHHATTSYFAATEKKVAAAAITAAIVAPVAIGVAGAPVGAAFTIGLVTTYSAYELLHRLAHTHAPRTRYGRWLRRHHFHHHFHDPAANHGVTSPLWDHLLGTYVEPGVVRVPEKHAMRWLVDPATGDAKEAFQDDYEIVRRGRRRAPSPHVAAPVTLPLAG